jgi:hypothetical protein
MPTIAPGGEAATGWIYTASGYRIRVLGAFSLYPAQSVEQRASLLSSAAGASLTANVGGDFQLVAGSLLGCVSLVRGVLDVGPCLGAQLGSMSAAGSESLAGAGGGGAPRFTRQSTVTQWVALEGGVLGSWSMTPVFAVFGRADTLLSVGQPSFYIDNSKTIPPRPKSTVYSMQTFAARAVLGLEVRFF